MRGLLATVITLAACAEHPSLRIEVTHDTVVAAEITSTKLSVYVSDQFTCEKVEFGDLSEEQLLTGLVDEVTIGDRDLVMSRTDPKVIVARGVDGNGTLYAAGCGEHEVITENDLLEIQTHRVATVSVNGIGLEDGDPFGIVVTVTDPHVVSIDERIVSWRVHGPAKTTPFLPDLVNASEPPLTEWVPKNPACSQPDGVRRIHPTPPATIGGYATDVRVSWAADAQRRFTTFTPVADAGRFSNFQPVSGSLRWCTGRIRSGVHRMVCLEDRGVPTAVEYEVIPSNGGAMFVEQPVTETFTVSPGENPLLVFSVVRNLATRDAYVLTDRGRVIGVFNPMIAAVGGTKLSAGERVVDAAVMQECGANEALLLVHVQDAIAAMPFRELRTMTANGAGTLAAFHSPRVQFTERLVINQTGCVAELHPGEDPIRRQVAVVDVLGRDTAMGPRNQTAAFFRCDFDDGKCSVPMAVPAVGVGFLAQDDPTSDPDADPQKHPERMVGATFDASGTVLSVTVLQPDTTGKPRPVELERITSAAFPQHLVTGRFDGDGQSDLFWDIVNNFNGSTNFQLSYARIVANERLSALSATFADLLVIDTAVADITGDGIEDVIIMSVDALPNPTRREVRVIPSQTPIKADNLQTDPKCTASQSP